MEIAILTFHCAHNYGAVLQTYALQEFLKEQGHSVHIIDYRPEYLIEPYRPFSLSRCKQAGQKLAFKVFLGECLRYHRQLKRYKAFNRFITKRLNLLSIDLKALHNDMDVFIYGSDQIWNPKICEGFDGVYFGDFNAAKGKKNIAYAASMGQSVLSDFEKKCLEKYLCPLTAVSVRESSLREMLLNLTLKNKHIFQVIDPTLLVSKSVFDKIAVAPAVHAPYVLVYQVFRDDNALTNLAQHVASQINGVVIEILSVIRKWKSSVNKLEHVSPEEFLGYISNARCVVTSSFHGTAFSVIMRKSFYTMKLNSDLDVRSESLLCNLGLENRAVQKDDRPVFSEVDFENISFKMSELQEHSRHFLLESIEK